MTISQLNKLPLYWEMANAEKIALLNLLTNLKPEIVIEIGTRKGGSLQLISALSSAVYCLDIDPSVELLGSEFLNVQFIIGDSKDTLPELLRELNNRHEQPDFILIDGDHSTQGVKTDIESIMESKITKPLSILMHDSFNPSCRKGMLEANYSLNPHVEIIEIDFIQGTFSPSETTRGEMWGGFGFVYVNPAVSNPNPVIKQSSGYSFERVFKLSNHYYSNRSSVLDRIKSYLFRKIYQ